MNGKKLFLQFIAIGISAVTFAFNTPKNQSSSWYEINATTGATPTLNHSFRNP